MIDFLGRRVVVSHVDVSSDHVANRPRGWPYCASAVAKQISDQPPRAFRPRDLLDPRCVFIMWDPSSKTLAAAMARRRMIYLCWGMPAERGSALVQRVKLARLRLLLRTADIVTVNDPVTAEEVRGLSGRHSIVIPNAVDTDFFSYAPLAARTDQVLVPGDNDRDEALVRQLAQAGVPVVRITREPRVAAYHEARGPLPNLDLRFNVSYLELRELYQTVKAVVLPISTRNHAAGQTSLLEAFGTGAPVVISEGRTASIGVGYGLQTVCSDNRLDTWLEAIANVFTRVDERTACECAERVSREHHPDHVTAVLVSLLRGEPMEPLP